MRLRALKRRYARRPRKRTFSAALRSWKGFMAKTMDELFVRFVHSEITAAELIAQPPGEPYTGPLLRGELGAVDCAVRFVKAP